MPDVGEVDDAEENVVRLAGANVANEIGGRTGEKRAL